MDKDLIIDQIGWHTQKVRNYEFNTTLIYEYFKAIMIYLESNNLTVRKLITNDNDLNDETCLRVSDLTDEGFSLIKQTYDKWVDGVVDKGKSPYDFKVLDKALKKLREKKSEQ